MDLVANDPNEDSLLSIPNYRRNSEEDHEHIVVELHLKKSKFDMKF
jgi:hypothetical protein